MPKELEIVILPQVQEQMDEDAELADDLRDLMAVFRQANLDVQNGKYETFEDAIEAITGERPEIVDVPLNGLE